MKEDLTMHYDVVIAGGGMTGAMLAYALQSQTTRPLKIAIVEKQPESQTKAPSQSFDSRSIALSAASVDLLASWGLWPELAPHACPISHISVSDRGHIGKVRLKAADFNRQSLGQVIEIERMGEVLYHRLAQVPATEITWYRPDQILKISQNVDALQLHLATGSVIEAKLLALCEGGDSPTRELAGIACQVQHYQQTALIANIGIAGDHQQKAFERFTTAGPLALLPLTRQRYSLVWTLSADDAARLIAAPAAEFLAELQQAFGYRAGVFQSVGERLCYPLALKTAEQASAHRLVLCGNSLHNLHPIAGQGFNLALRDLAALVHLVAAHSDVGSYALTKAYANVRQQDMQQVVTLTDGLVRLFSNDSKLLALGRTLGLSLLHNCQPLKTVFAQQTMGLSPLHRQQQQLSLSKES
jgi:2-octaprenyl-6-methoxyphenol hydroxylase